MWRDTWSAETPFFASAIIAIAINHFVSGK
jgi:hypothetical protein